MYFLTWYKSENLNTARGFVSTYLRIRFHSGFIDSEVRGTIEVLRTTLQKLIVDSEVRLYDSTKLSVDSKVRSTTQQKLIVDSGVRGTTLQKLIVKSE